MTRKLTLFTLAISAALFASACNTVRGAGADLNSAANETQAEINK